MPLPPLTGFQQASLEIEGESEPLNCWFNPKEYTIAKQNTWKTDTAPGKALPLPQYTGGQPRKLTLNLLFDSTDSTDANVDVGSVTGRLFKMMESQKALAGGAKNTGRPPTVTFNWGKTVTFKAVADSLSVQFLLFRADGTPVRAQAAISLIQVEKAMDKSSGRGDPKKGNPTTRAMPGLGSHTIRDGDSLASIAFLHYRDPTRWRAIAEANGIDDPLRLRRGRILSIPRIEG
jgi:nucleoid-associated protein YgaU